METSLITHDGFPRSDINVLEIRNARVKIIRLRNDLNAIINELSEKMQSQFYNSNKESESNDLGIPFAKVTEVVANSPADKAVSITMNKIVLKIRN